MILALIVILIVIGAAGWGLSRYQPGADSSAKGTGDWKAPTASWDAGRIFLYALSFAGLMAALFGLSELIALVIAQLTLPGDVVMSPSSAKERASYYLASLIVGTPIWWSLWRVAQRRVTRLPEERQARERRWYLAGIFAITAVVALFGLHTVLRVLLTLPGSSDPAPTVRDGIYAALRLLAWGCAWLAYALLGWRERSPRDRDEAHDLAVYVLSAFSLVFLVIGLVEAIRQVTGDTVASPHSTLSSSGESTWTTWAGIAAWSIAGGLVWGAIQQYDLERGGRRLLRLVYLYAVLVVAVPAALGGGIDGLYELLRRIFGYADSAGTWHFLQDMLPPLLIGTGVWAYHWSMMRRQAVLFGDTAWERGGIPWPRRLGLLLLTLAGLVVTASAFTLLLWLALDRALDSGVALSGGAWWRDRVSASIAGGIVGSIVWLRSWSILQRAAAADPERERTAQERRRMLGLVALAGTLTAIGFAVALLWTVFHALLGGSLGASTADSALKDLTGGLIALALAGYHGAILRGDLRLRPARPRQLRLQALVAPGAEGMLTHLDRPGERPVEVIGFLSPVGTEGMVDPVALETRLATLEQQDGIEGALLIVQRDGIVVHPYGRRTLSPVPQPAIEGSIHGDDGSVRGPAIATGETS